MKHIRGLAILLIVMTVMMGVLTSSAKAYLWSSYANLEITVKPGVFGVDVINCSSATLSGQGRIYKPSVTNPILSNNCVFRVSNAYVGNGVYYNLNFTYKWLTLPGSKTVQVYVKRPVTATYSTSVSYKP